MKNNDNIGKSINKRLGNLSQKLGLSHQNVVTEFLIERLLARITSSNDIRNKITFKGGYVCLRIYESDRNTIDLDAVLQKGNLRKTINLIKDIVTKDFEDGVWFIFEEEIDLLTQGEYGGIRLVFRTGIGSVLKNIKRAQIIHFDLGYGDPITPCPIEKVIMPILGGEKIPFAVYPVETTVAEKLNALITRKDFNSRSKDVYDLYFLLPKSDKIILKTAIKNTFKYRKDEIPKSFSKEIESIDRTVLSKGWNKAVKLLKNPISFDEAFNLVINYCKVLIDD